MEMPQRRRIESTKAGAMPHEQPSQKQARDSVDHDGREVDEGLELQWSRGHGDGDFFGGRRRSDEIVDFEEGGVQGGVAGSPQVVSVEDDGGLSPPSRGRPSPGWGNEYGMWGRNDHRRGSPLRQGPWVAHVVGQLKGHGDVI